MPSHKTADQTAAPYEVVRLAPSATVHLKLPAPQPGKGVPSVSANIAVIDVRALFA